jgi:hypothetical protein
MTRRVLPLLVTPDTISEVASTLKQFASNIPNILHDKKKAILLLSNSSPLVSMTLTHLQQILILTGVEMDSSTLESPLKTLFTKSLNIHGICGSILQNPDGPLLLL